VKEIIPDADHKGYTIKARHWEPRAYLEAMKAEEDKKAKPAAKGKSDIAPHLLFGSASGFAVGAVLIKKALPLARAQLPQHAELIAQVLKVPLAVYGACVVLGIAIVLLMHAVAAGSAPAEETTQAASCMDIPPVGKDGRVVSVAEMAVGGSGGSSTMQGETVEVETIRTQYVVNAAGCYSVSLLYVYIGVRIVEVCRIWPQQSCCFSRFLPRISG
jgi:hypothetical protein